MLITNNEDALRVKCSDVTLDEVSSIRAALESELDRCNRLGKSGIGLAAPQIGIAKKMAIIRLDGFNLDLVNCKIKTGYDEITFTNEACLSFPGRSENTKRFQQIHVIENLIGHSSFIANGMLSIVIQHESDHFNQSLFFDHMIAKKVEVSRNDNCPCGKNLKFKKCCGKK